MRSWLVAAGIIPALAFAACGGGGDERTIDIGDGEVTLGGDLPDDFPDDFPVYRGADVQGSYRGEQDGVEGSITTWTTGDDYDDVVAFYESEFEDGPWSSEGDSSFSGSGSSGFTFWSVEHEDDDLAGYVSVTDGDEVVILAAIGDDTSLVEDRDDDSDDDGSDDGSDDIGSDDDSDDNGSDDGSADDGPDDDGSGDGSGSDADIPDEVDLPDGFPTDIVTVPDGARITNANRITSGGSTTWSVTIYSEDDFDALGEYFKREIEGNGYTETSSLLSSDGVYAVYAENDDGSGDSVIVTISEAIGIDGWNVATAIVTRGE